MTIAVDPGTLRGKAGIVDQAALSGCLGAQTALHEFTDRLYRSQSEADVYDAALEAIRHALGCERASILLLDASDTMKFVAWRGLSDGYREAVEGHSPWARGSTDPKPICIPDIDTADIDDALKATVKGEGIRALAFIPLVEKGGLVGKFMTYYGAAHAFTDTEMDIAVTIARQLGFAVAKMRAETARFLAEQQMSDFFENASIGMHWVGSDGTILRVNRCELEMLGYRHDEYVGRHIAEFHVGQDAIKDILTRLSKREVLNNYEARLRHRDGSIRDVLISSSVLWDQDRFVHTRCFTTDVTERRQAQARTEFLTQEIQHRTKNLFAVVQSVVGRSFAGKRTVSEAQSAVMDRLHSLGQTHLMLMDKDWQGADLAEVVRSEMSPYAGRVTVDGPAVLLNAKAAQNFALMLHELATNAAKYGSLSNTSGQVHIGWSVTRPNGSRRYVFHWQERGGPRVYEPQGKGFSSVVLEQVMAEYSDSHPVMEFAETGLIYQVSGPLASIAAEGGADGETDASLTESQQLS